MDINTRKTNIGGGPTSSSPADLCFLTMDCHSNQKTNRFFFIRVFSGPFRRRGLISFIASSGINQVSLPARTRAVFVSWGRTSSLLLGSTLVGYCSFSFLCTESRPSKKNSTPPIRINVY